MVHVRVMRYIALVIIMDFCYRYVTDFGNCRALKWT